MAASQTAEVIQAFGSSPTTTRKLKKSVIHDIRVNSANFKAAENTHSALAVARGLPVAGVHSPGANSATVAFLGHLCGLDACSLKEGGGHVLKPVDRTERDRGEEGGSSLED